MNRKYSSILISILISVLLVTLLSAQDLPGVPTVINYQGYLTDSDGKALEGKHKITFRIFEEPTGSLTGIWEEIHDSVMVSNGLLNVLLGSIKALTPVHFMGDRYLEIQVGDEDELEPRLHLVSVAYSLRAGQANNAFWRSPWYSVLNITSTHKTATVRYNANDEAKWIFASPHFVAERNLVITGCQLMQDDRSGGDTYYVQLTKNGAEVGDELAISVKKKQELFFENFPEGLSFSQGDKIGVRLRSAAGGTEEVCCLLSGYCTN